MASIHHCIKSGKKGNARRHSRYIGREGSHSNREDLIHTGYVMTQQFLHRSGR